MYTLNASYAAQGNFNASSTLAPTTLTVSQATPVITWSPAPLPLGSMLSASQLDATANVPGMFAYTPSAGTVVSTTGQMVSVLFTPADTSDYTTATKSVSLTVTPGPVALVSPSMINFGTVYLGSITTRNVTLTNTGNAAMTVTGPFLSLVKGGNSNEFVEVNQCPKSLAAGKNCTMTIAFVAGPFYSPQNAVLSIMDNAPGNPQSVALTAMVINPQAMLSTSSLNFGTQKMGMTSSTKPVTLKNTGATALTIQGVTVAGADPGDFLPSSACPSSLGAGLSCTIEVAFKPSSKTSRSATLTIKDNALNSPQTVALSGKGN